MVIKVLSEPYVVAKLQQFSPSLPILKANCCSAPKLFSLTITDEEISLVCPETDLQQLRERQQAEILVEEKGWRCLRIQGVIDFQLIGVIAAIASLLAGAGISLFVLSTYNTDYILVKGASLEQSLALLESSGYTLE